MKNMNWVRRLHSVSIPKSYCTLSLKMYFLFFFSHSNLGPVDPQINGVPAYEYLKMYKDALSDIKTNNNVIYWTNVLSKYTPTFFGICNNAIASARTILTSWLNREMLKGNSNGIKKTVDYLLDYNTHLLHNNRLDIDTLSSNTCLKIKLLEDDDKLQEYVLSLYHCSSLHYIL